MEWIINQLRDHPELAIFLTLFAGFWLGRFNASGTCTILFDNNAEFTFIKFAH